MDLTDPTTVTTADLRSAYRAGELTPVDALEAVLHRIDAVDGVLNSIAYLNSSEAREQAEASATRWATGDQLGPLDGVPVSIKDSVASTGTPWRHGAAANRRVPDSTFDAPPAARLKEAGAIVFAKTTMPDFGMLASGVSSLYGIVRNPWNLSMSPGGSSAGAGASLAAGIGWAAVGSDIAGSVRLPAGHCGLVSLKPTQGRIPHLAPSTVRSAGPMARTVAEATELLSVLSGPDARDLFSLPGGAVRVEQCMPDLLNLPGLRVGVLTDMGYGPGLHPLVKRVVRAAADALSAAGASVEEMEALFDHNPYPALDRLFQVRARAEWESLSEAGRDQVLPEISEWSSRAVGITGAQHENDLGAVARSAAQVQQALLPYDMVLSPILPGLGHRAEMVGLDPTAPLAHCSFTCWHNQTGAPAATVPFGAEEGVPVGVQIVGRRFDDARVMQVAGWLERHRTISLAWPVIPVAADPLEPALFASEYQEA
ncbi:amidase [Microbacterium trichothecenolyticum]|uniref:Amidase n=1 Tax=Microbacterium ureisolvens TaxID=2781186 RepID=A0ABS7I2W7_9MICO|nr:MULTISPECIES: amidase [Microbacterium]MBW9111981.1 amidase [Microbacterium ureisolvens]MBW9122410.1 amidase [Microbacterium trichothecenolyticum]